MPQVLIAIFVTLIVSAPVAWILATNYYKKVSEAKIGNAEERRVRLLMKP